MQTRDTQRRVRVNKSVVMDSSRSRAEFGGTFNPPLPLSRFRSSPSPVTPQRDGPSQASTRRITALFQQSIVCCGTFVLPIFHSLLQHGSLLSHCLELGIFIDEYSLIATVSFLESLTDLALDTLDLQETLPRWMTETSCPIMLSPPTINCP